MRTRMFAISVFAAIAVGLLGLYWGRSSAGRVEISITVDSSSIQLSADEGCSWKTAAIPIEPGSVHVITVTKSSVRLVGG